MALIDPQLKEVLVCPCPHHAALTEDETNSQLLCTQCALAFPVHEGIPVMLLEEAVTTPEYDPEKCGAAEVVAQTNDSVSS